MKRKLMIATIAAVSSLGATAASAQTIRSTILASDGMRFSSVTYLPGQGGCVDDQGFARKNVCE